PAGGRRAADDARPLQGQRARHDRPDRRPDPLFGGHGRGRAAAGPAGQDPRAGHLRAQAVGLFPGRADHGASGIPEREHGHLAHDGGAARLAGPDQGPARSGAARYGGRPRGAQESGGAGLRAGLFRRRRQRGPDPQRAGLDARDRAARQHQSRMRSGRMALDESLVSLSAVELRRLIGARQVSPVELLEACIERIAQVNPYINAVTATAYERAREEARQAERAVLAGQPLGLLHGLPLGVKDLEPTAGVLTTYGSPLYRGHVPAEDVELGARLRRAGAIVAAKTNVPEMGAGANSRNAVWGATGNPFNPNLNAGGSSGGSAAALACDMLPVCTGSDTGGSLRIPAKCGVVGFRPSPGWVPSARKPLGWTPISVVGPMGRTVADACLQLAASAGTHAGDPLSYPLDPLQFLQPRPADLGALRVAYTEDFGACAVDDGIRAAFRAKIAAMRHLFAACDPVEMQLGEVHRCFDVL